jgi:enediyne biosynthesis protein E4
MQDKDVPCLVIPESRGHIGCRDGIGAQDNGGHDGATLLELGPIPDGRGASRSIQSAPFARQNSIDDGHGEVAKVMPAVRQWGRVLALAAVAGGALYGCWWLSRVWHHRAALMEIREHVQAGRHGTAARNLAELLAWEPGSDEAIYLLGVCENARGRTAAAEAAWARLPPGSAFAVPAILARATFLVDQGRLADAERLIDQALGDPRVDGFDLRRFLAPLYRSEGRIEDALRLIEANWFLLNRGGRGGSRQAIELLGLHLAQTMSTASAESVRTFLERVLRQAPDDDRIWLGKANLAIRQGSFDEAARWLDACIRRRPEDMPVWRARLEWAMATGRTSAAGEALEHLPADGATPAQVHRLAAWFAARRGDAESECRAAHHCRSERQRRARPAG